MKEHKNEENNPSKVYREESQRKGGDLLDSEEESAARDNAKMDRTNAGMGQKIDSVHPDELLDTGGLDPEDEIEQKG